jgi:myo-inositol-hexaphosphate 3-phosphohydrolase
LLALLALAVAVAARAAAGPVEVHATLETEPFFGSDDADDPAIWLGGTTESPAPGRCRPVRRECHHALCAPGAHCC